MDDTVTSKKYALKTLALSLLMYTTAVAMEVEPQWKKDLSPDEISANKPFFPFKEIVDQGGSLPGLDRAESIMETFEHLAAHAATSEKNSAQYRLAFLKLIYNETQTFLSTHDASSPWPDAITELNAIEHNIQNDMDATSKTKTHATIWKARTYIKYALVQENPKDKQSKLCDALKMLQNAHDHGATDSCLLWEAELYIRHGLRTIKKKGILLKIGDAKALELAREALDKVGVRYKKTKYYLAKKLEHSVMPQATATQTTTVINNEEPMEEVKAHNPFMSKKNQKELEYQLRQELDEQERVGEALGSFDDHIDSSNDSDSSSSSSDEESYDYEANNPVMPKMGTSTFLSAAGFEKQKLNNLAEQHPRLAKAINNFEIFFKENGVGANFYSYSYAREINDALGEEKKLIIFAGSNDAFDTIYDFPVVDPAKAKEFILYRMADKNSGKKGKWWLLKKVERLEDKRKRDELTTSPSHNHIENQRPAKKARVFVSEELRARIVKDFTEFKATHKDKRNLCIAFATEERQKGYNLSYLTIQRVLTNDGILEKSVRSLSFQEKVNLVQKYCQFIKDTPDATKKNILNAKYAKLRQDKIKELTSNGSKIFADFLGNLGILCSDIPSDEKIELFQNLLSARDSYLKTHEQSYGWKKGFYQSFDTNQELENFAKSAKNYRRRSSLFIAAEVYEECVKQGIFPKTK